jgi:hypothetical protein
MFANRYSGRHPDGSVLACSHTQELAHRIGRRVQNLFSSPAPPQSLCLTVAADFTAALVGKPRLAWRILLQGHRHRRAGQGPISGLWTIRLNRGESTRSLQLWLGRRFIQHKARCAELSAKRFKHW